MNADRPAVDVLARWLLEWATTDRDPTDIGIGCLHDLHESDVAHLLAAALIDPAQHGPLANPEFVMKLPGHTPSCIHVNATNVTLTRSTP